MSRTEMSSEKYQRATRIMVILALAVVVLGGISIARAASPSQAKGGDAVYFASKARGSSDIWSVVAGQKPQRMAFSSTGSDDIDPTISKDGRWLAFASKRDGNFEIYTVDLNAGSKAKPIRVTMNTAHETQPAWAPDGITLAYVTNRYSKPEIMKAPRTGCGRRVKGCEIRLTKNKYYDNQPTWSPDGKTIAFSSKRKGDRSTQIYTMDTRGRSVKKLTSDRGNSLRPAYSPDGSKIAFSSKRSSSRDRTYAIYTMSSTGANQKRLTAGTSNDSAPKWNSASSAITYVSSSRRSSVVNSISTSGGKPTKVTTSRTSIRSIALGSSGSSIVSGATTKPPAPKPTPTPTPRRVAPTPRPRATATPLPQPTATPSSFGQTPTSIFPFEDPPNQLTTAGPAKIEISGIPLSPTSYATVEVISAPGIILERIPGFAGRAPSYQAGEYKVLPFIFEYGGEEQPALANYKSELEDPKQCCSYRVISLIVEDQTGNEAYQWQLHDMALVSISQASSGMQRYTFEYAGDAPIQSSVSTLPLSNAGNPVEFPVDPSFNPATDTHAVEISGVQVGPYPIVGVDESNNTIEMIFDSNEAGEIVSWIMSTANGNATKRELYLIDVDESAAWGTNSNLGYPELARRNFYEVIPIEYQVLSGMDHSQKTRHRLVVSYDYWIDGARGSTIRNFQPTGPVVPSAPVVQHDEQFADDLGQITWIQIGGITLAEEDADRGLVHVVSGPGWKVERVSGFLDGRPFDQPGEHLHLPLIFEYSGRGELALANWWTEQNNSNTCPKPTDCAYRTMSLITRDRTGSEAGRWNFNNYRLEKISAGSDGRKRYEFEVIIPSSEYGTNSYIADNSLGLGTDVSFNPATDSFRVEIEGITAGVYPKVTVDESNRTIEMIFDYNEGSGIKDWIQTVFGGNSTKRVVTLITENPATRFISGSSSSWEVSRLDYHGAFPIEFEVMPSMGKTVKVQHRIVLSYDFSEIPK